MPLSAEMPAPVSATTRPRDARISSRIFASLGSMTAGYRPAGRRGESARRGGGVKGSEPALPAGKEPSMQMNEMFVALGVPLGAFFMAVAIVALVGYFKHQARTQRAELIKLALERGQPLPAGLLD